MTKPQKASHVHNSIMCFLSHAFGAQGTKKTTVTPAKLHSHSHGPAQSAPALAPPASFNRRFK